MRILRIVVFSTCAALLVLSSAAQAVSTLRVGNQVLTVGDSEVRVTELLGKPTHKSHSRRARASRVRGSRRVRGGVRVLSDQDSGDKWQYRRDDHVTTLTIVDGRVVDIDDRRL